MDSLSRTVAAGMMSLPCLVVATPSLSADETQSHAWWKPYARFASADSLVSQVQHFEADLLDVPNLSAHPGRALTAQALSRIERQRALLGAVEGFQSTVPVQIEATVNVTRAAVAAAKHLILLLPDDGPMPQVAPDGEGGLVLVWSRGAEDVLIVVDGSHLHAVVSPATSHTRYIDDEVFASSTLVIPDSIQNVIPTS